MVDSYFINDSLGSVRYEAGNEPPSDTNRCAIFNQMSPSIRAFGAGSAKGIKWRWVRDLEQVTTRLRLRLQRVLTNLVSNAFTDSGSVKYYQVLTDDQWAIFVSDTGIGNCARRPNHIILTARTKRVPANNTCR